MPQQFLNGIRIDWHDVDDLPGYCGSCPFYFDGSTSTPCVGQVAEQGICNLRGMMKARYADAPQACLRLFRKVLRFPNEERLTIVLKD